MDYFVKTHFRYIIHLLIFQYIQLYLKEKKSYKSLYSYRECTMRVDNNSGIFCIELEQEETSCIK